MKLHYNHSGRSHTKLKFESCFRKAPSFDSNCPMAHANAMWPLYQRFGGNDADIAALFREVLAPWMLYTKPPNVKPAIPETEAVVTVLEKALMMDPMHLGLCHFYMELSATPEKALPTAMLCVSVILNRATSFTCPLILICEWGNTRRPLK